VIALQNSTDVVAFLRTHVRGTLCTDSRHIGPGDGFIAYPGSDTDGRAYVSDAIARGAAACVVEHAGMSRWLGQNFPLPMASLPQLQTATGEIAAQWFDQPSRSVQVFAVTGTNGKTSITWWLAEALNTLSFTSPCAVIGTLGIGIPPHLEATGLTTPDAVSMQRALRTLADRGVGYAALEASSIGLAQQRLAATCIDVAVFTNFTQDHLDWHGSMTAYWQAKRTLFDWPGLHAAVIHIDDPYGAELLTQLQGHKNLDLWPISTTGAARLTASHAHHTEYGLAFTVTEGHTAHAVQTRQLGTYNAANILSVLAVLRMMNVPLDQAVAACAKLGGVPGRMQVITPLETGARFAGPLTVVDYAHTPDALRHALRALRPVAKRRGGKLWCVFGCGGHRDTSKRPLMGAVAQQEADSVIVTSDNPRDEIPEVIISHITQGMTVHNACCAVPDRSAAITQALSQAHTLDVVLIAGKGHEEWQEVAGQRRPFSDVAQARAVLTARWGCA